MNIEAFQQAVAGGRIFTVDFVKRTTGEPRTMNCRCGVSKHAKGGDLAYKPAEAKLLPVYDLQAQGYRQVPLDSITALKLAGKVYRWDADAAAFVVVP